MLRLSLLAVAALALLPAACAHPSAAGPRLPRGSRLGQASLEPRSLQIHPLTRIGTDPEGQPALIVHAELLDDFEQSAKALGTFNIELFRPGGGLSPSGLDVQDTTWEIDLTEPDRNALLYDDLVTRTYTLTLGGLPDWAVEWSRNPAARGDDPPRHAAADAPSIQVTFTFGPRPGARPPPPLTATHRLMR